MKINRFIFSLVVFFVGEIAFCTPQSRELFIICNNSNKTVIIIREFSDVSKSSNPKNDLFWSQKINVYKLSIFASSFTSSEIRLLPSQSVDLVRISPWFLELDEVIPFMDKMRSIFKLLSIITEDQKLLITLDNLEEYVVKHEYPIGPMYILEIHDSD